MQHELKIYPPYFQAVLDGDKTFEIRKDDRGFQKGDTVILKEYDIEHRGRYIPEEERYTGREYCATIGYVTSFAQQPGYVVFSLKPLSSVIVVNVNPSTKEITHE